MQVLLIQTPINELHNDLYYYGLHLALQ